MKSRIFLAPPIAAIAAVSAPAAFATHSWNGYHWARTANPFTLKLGNNLTSADWQSRLSQTSSDWSKSTVLDTSIVAGQARNPIAARPPGAVAWSPSNRRLAYVVGFDRQLYRSDDA